MLPGNLEENLRFFDGLAPVTPDELWGTWTGKSVPTGHPMDGLLEEYGWYGKEFRSVDEVRPLLFRSRRNDLFEIDPSRLPVNLLLHHPGFFRKKIFAWAFRLFGELASTEASVAHLRPEEYRGVESCAMVYNDLPIRDFFRRVDSSTMMGVMSAEGIPPFCFKLCRLS